VSVSETASEKALNQLQSPHDVHDDDDRNMFIVYSVYTLTTVMR